MFMRNDIKKLKQDLSIKTNLLNHDLTLKTRWGVF
ncbi:Ribosomal RNA small subunit methyltransferase C (EC, partial [Bathymodiolus brooksi thiotrophic gill symbiont]